MIELILATTDLICTFIKDVFFPILGCIAFVKYLRRH